MGSGDHVRCEATSWKKALMLGGLVVVACDTTTTDDTGPQDTEVEPVPATLEPSTCGETYDTLDPHTLGQLVDWEPAPEFSLSAELLQGVAASAGLGDIHPTSGMRAWRIRYTTQDRGREVEATGLIGLPDPMPEEAVPVMLWHHHSMGFTDACGPSGRTPEGISQVLMAAFGYAVVAPDYLGMNGWGAASEGLHPYIVAEPTAVASLDALRAFRRWEADGTAPWSAQQTQDATVFMGGSEGGFGTVWSHRLQPTYYPEVSVAAAVAFVPPVDIPAMVREAVSEVRDVTSGVAAFLTAADAWYEQGVLPDILTDTAPAFYASQMVDGLSSSCDAFDIERPEAVSDLYTPAFEEAGRTGQWDGLEAAECYQRENSLVSSPLTPSTAPVYMVAGELDTLVVGITVREGARALCDQGMQIRYRECAGADHTGAVGEGLPDALRWLSEELAGGAADALCEITPPEDCVAAAP
jgi:hypothetical protein